MYRHQEALPEDIQDFPPELTRSPVIETPHHNRQNINERLRAIQPDDFAKAEGLRADPERSTVQLHEDEKQRVQLVSDLLKNPKLQELIEAGKITVALVKPQVHKGKSGSSDSAIADKIIREEIKPPLRVLFALPTHMTPNDVKYFYASIYDMLSNKPDAETNGKTTAWARFEKYMTSGATTMVLLYSEQGGAVDEWRKQLGPTMPDKDPEGETIRGKYGWDIRGNVGHGSNEDTPEQKVEAVKYESGWMSQKVDKMLETHETGDKFMSEETMRANGILEEGEVFLAVERFIPKQKISYIGSSFTAYIISLIGKKGKQTHRRFMVKSFDNAETAEGGINQALAEGERNRTESFAELLKKSNPTRHFSRLKTGTPKVYNVAKDNEGAPALLREYVPSSNSTVLSVANNADFDVRKRCDIIDGLIYAAALMDSEGIKSRNIVENFLYNGKQWIYFGSSSVGIESASKNEVSTGLADLLQKFGDDPKLSSEIRKRYNKHRVTISAKKRIQN